MEREVSFCAKCTFRSLPAILPYRGNKDAQKAGYFSENEAPNHHRSLSGSFASLVLFQFCDKRVFISKGIMKNSMKWGRKTHNRLMGAACPRFVTLGSQAHFPE